MSTATDVAKLFKSLLDLARRPMPTPGAASQPKQMFLERDWLGADLYHRERGGPR